MKRLIALLMAGTMLLSLAGCGAAAPAAPAESAPKTEESAPAEEAAGEEASAEESYEPITIQFWNGWTGSDAQVLVELVEETLVVVLVVPQH